MKNYRITLFGMSAALFLSFAGPASAAPARDWPQWLAHYYQSPHADEVVPAVFALSSNGYFDKADQRATAIGFLGAVFAQNPARTSVWVSAFRFLPAAHQRLVASALWYSGLPDGAEQLRTLARDCSPALRDEIEQLIAHGAPSLRETPVLSESSLNLQWGAFLATGEPQHILNVLTALGSSEPGLNSAARLALAEKAAAHQRVYEICQAQLTRQPANVREQMRAAMVDVKTQP